MANEYMKSNETAAGLVIPVKMRKAATDKSSVNSINKAKPGPGTAPMSAPRSGKGTANGPSQVIKGVYTQPVAGGGKF
jgi:hypothetical protein